MTKHLTALLAAVLFCGVLASVSQKHPPMVRGAGAAARKAPAKPATKPAAKPKPKRRSNLPTPAEERELLGFLKKGRREFYNGLMAQKKISDQRYRRTLQHAWQWYKRYKSLDKTLGAQVDREQKARIEISKILGKLKKTTDSKARNKLVSDLQRQASVQFDAQMRITEAKLDKARNQLDRLRQELNNRKSQRKIIVEQRVGEWLKSAGKPKPAPKKK